MARKPVYSSRRLADAREQILAGRIARKALAMGMGITCTVLDEWLVAHADFASCVADTKAEYTRIKAEQKQKQGRKSAYRPSFDASSRLHAATGKSDADIAKELDISTTTLRNWRESHPSLHAAIQDGRDHWAVTTVEQSLIKRAQGYNYTEKIVEDSEKSGKRVATMTKHMPPDTKAAQFVLTNRAPDRWKNKQEVAHSGAVGLDLPENLSDLMATIFGAGEQSPSDQAAGAPQ